MFFIQTSPSSFLLCIILSNISFKHPLLGLDVHNTHPTVRIYLSLVFRLLAPSCGGNFTSYFATFFRSGMEVLFTLSPTIDGIN